MKRFSFLGLFLLSQILSAQTFTELPQSPILQGVWNSSHAFDDVNGDGHPDLILSGYTAIQGASGFFTRMYANDGHGNFSAINITTFEQLRYSAVAFEDVNGDGHSDVLIAGQNNSFSYSANLYLNDGMGNFTLKTGTPLTGVARGSVAFEDINGDNYPDLLIIGAHSAFESSTTLYTNDGQGNFTPVTGQSFKSFSSATGVFSDVNGDGHPDIVISGIVFSGGMSWNEWNTLLYTNDGVGNFTETSASPFDNSFGGNIAMEDVNNDGHPDLLISGLDSNTGQGYSTKLYTNDGMGNFTNFPFTPFGSFSGEIAFSDVNLDGNPDLLFAGGPGLTKLYTNGGNGNFTELAGTSFTNLTGGSVALSDVNGSGYPDVLIAGYNDMGDLFTKLYINNSVASSNEESFTESPLHFTPYPNPISSNRLNANYHANENDFITIGVYDLRGMLLRQQKEFTEIGQQTVSIELDALPKGTYLIEINNGKRKGVSKFIVQ